MQWSGCSLDYRDRSTNTTERLRGIRSHGGVIHYTTGTPTIDKDTLDFFSINGGHLIVELRAGRTDCRAKYHLLMIDDGCSPKRGYSMNEKKAQEERRLRVSMRLYVFEFVHARVCVWYPAKARYDTERQESAREQTRMEKKKRHRKRK